MLPSLFVRTRHTALRRLSFAVLLLGAVPFLVGGCEVTPSPNREQQRVQPWDTAPRYEEPESIFGPGGLTLFGSGNDTRGGGSGGGIGVNSYLWRAALDTIAFMPVTSADPFGGVVLTDWHSPPETPDERFKVDVYILGRELRADGVRVAVFRQVEGTGGTWRDRPVSGSVATDMENAILMRARQLRNETVNQ